MQLLRICVSSCAASLMLLVLADASSAGEAGASPTTQNEEVYFEQDLMPLLTKLGCNQSACHGAPAGKGSFRLSMFGAEADQDYDALVRHAAGRRIDRLNPVKSLLLMKATESIPHGGGKRFAVDSPEYHLFLKWIVGGARKTAPNAPEVLRIELGGEKRILQKGESLAISVEAVYSDGSRRQVTSLARLRSLDPTVVSVSADGTAKAEGFGQTVLVANFMRRAGVMTFVVPQPLPEPFPEWSPHNKIDELVHAKLKELGLPPSELCTDQEFLRRIYLDVIGRLPSAEEAKSFAADQSPDKRNRLIDRLLASEEFADFWALKWGDLFRIKSEFPSNLWPNAVQAYYQWVRRSIAQNKPFDQFARELLVSSGSNFRDPPVNFYRAFLKREPQNLSEVAALIFMGARLGCARCHAHPDERWKLEDSLGMAAFFAQIRYKPTTEWKEEIVYIVPSAQLRHPVSGEPVAPKFLDGETVKLEPGQDAREVFARWLTSPDNPWFAKNIVNRTWYWLLGRGIVHEADDLRPSNPPRNPELLDYLARELVEKRYDLKHIYRLILSSRTYQLSSKPNQWNKDDTAHFSHYFVKRLGAETLLDALSDVTERWDTYRSIIPEPFVELPAGFRATHLADGSISLPFLELFGRPPRDTAFESDRDMEISARQTLHLLNSGDVQNKIASSPRIQRMITEKKSDDDVIEEIYLVCLSRYPTAEEKERLKAFLARDPKQRTSAIQDIVWAVVNSKEFLFNH